MIQENPNAKCPSGPCHHALRIRHDNDTTVCSKTFLPGHAAAPSPGRDPSSQILNDLSHFPLHNHVHAFNAKFDRGLVHLDMVLQQPHLFFRGALGVWDATQIRIVGLVHPGQNQLYVERDFVGQLNDAVLSWLVDVSICYGLKKRTASREAADEHQP